jgi:hypothetical protein
VITAGGGQTGGPGGVTSVGTPAVGLEWTNGQAGGLPLSLQGCGVGGGRSGFAGTGAKCADQSGPAVPAVAGFVILHLAQEVPA